MLGSFTGVHAGSSRIVSHWVFWCMPFLTLFRLLLEEDFIVKTALIGWISYADFARDWPEAFLACCVCLGGFLPLF